MLIVTRKEDENIGQMVKRYKRKVRKTKLISELRSRKHFEKKSVQRRHEILNAEYRLNKYGED